MFFSQVKEGLLNYIQNEIISKAEGPMKFVLYTGVALATPKLDEMYNQYKHNPVIKTLDIIKDNDEIDVQALHKAMRHAIVKMERFEFMGIIFNVNDVDNLFKYINQVQGGVTNERQINQT